jgi:hypothetical protein
MVAMAAGTGARAGRAVRSAVKETHPPVNWPKRPRVMEGICFWADGDAGKGCVGYDGMAGLDGCRERAGGKSLLTRRRWPGSSGWADGQPARPHEAALSGTPGRLAAVVPGGCQRSGEIDKVQWERAAVSSAPVPTSCRRLPPSSSLAGRPPIWRGLAGLMLTRQEGQSMATPVTFIESSSLGL